MQAPQIILASQSPRRRQLLDQVGVVFSIGGLPIDESMRAGESATIYVTRMAREKAETALEGALIPVLGADTVVVAGPRILGKPQSRSEAVEMLNSLSGRKHQVITAVALITAAGEYLQSSNTTTVEFEELSAAQISVYCDSEEPLDKAGAYAVQGRAAVFIKRIEGSYSGVMGLPLHETAVLLRQAGVSVPAAG